MSNHSRPINTSSCPLFRRSSVCAIVRCSHRLSILSLAFLMLGFSQGCKRKAVVNNVRAKTLITRQETNPFEVAVEFMNSLDQYQPAQAHAQILNNLREWVGDQKASVDWSADPMFVRLPADIKQNFSSDNLNTKEFISHDAFVLQETVWLRDVAQNMASKPLFESNLKSWLEKSVEDETMTRDQAADLSLVYRLFDWTIRSIQLDSDWQSRDYIGGEKESQQRDSNSNRHVYYPWENMLYGHGDWLERSRVFIQLARQVGINVVMLSAEREKESDQPWVPAALIGDELYLFDTQLGIPLPGKGGALFGTLANYVEEPELLDDLSIDSIRYRIVQSDLGNIVPAIDATPSQLSQRMKQVEVRLTGDRKMVLTVEPSALTRKLRACKGINGNPHIWPFPYRGYLFAMELSKITAAYYSDNTPIPTHLRELLADLKIEQRPFESRSDLMQGRLLQFRGKYRGDDDKLGAINRYMNSRMSKRDLQRFNIPFSEVPVESPLRRGLPEDMVQADALYRQRMVLGRELAVYGKQLATYWLGTAAFERQEFKVSQDFLRIPVEEASSPPPSPWLQSARYNLARSIEALAENSDDAAKLIDEAITLYESDQDTPQRAGNLLRAKSLRARLN